MNRPSKQRVLKAEQELSSGNRSYTGQVIDYSLYDKIKLASTTLEYRLFTVGQGFANKDRSDTNMWTNGLIPKSHKMVVHELFVAYKGAGVASKPTTFMPVFYNYLWNTTAEFKVPGKDEAGTWTLSELFGLSNNVQMVPSVAGDNIATPYNVFTARKKFKNPWLLPSLENFEIKLTTYKAAIDATEQDDDELMVSFIGKLGRLN